MAVTTDGIDARFGLPSRPTYPTLEAEREAGKRRLAAAFRIFGGLGLNNGNAGHLVLRDPILRDHFWVNRAGVHFSDMKVSDLIMVDPEGQIVAQSGARLNPVAHIIHKAVLEARPDVECSIHAHGTFSMAWASKAVPLPPAIQDSCAFFEDQGVLTEFNGAAIDPSEGRSIADALGNHKLVILKNHGLLTVGATVDSAAWWFIRFERCCQVQLALEAAGDWTAIDEQTARLTASQLGVERAGWNSFQPLYQNIIQREPDLLIPEP